MSKNMDNQKQRDRARRLVKQYTGAQCATADVIEKVVDRIVDNGECVWHAAAMVTGKPCMCHDCR